MSTQDLDALFGKSGKGDYIQGGTRNAYRRKNLKMAVF